MGAEDSTERDRLARDRTELAYERNVLANERTIAAWTRTGLGSLGAGVVIAKLAKDVEPPWLTVGIGVALALAGALLQGFGLWSYLRVARAQHAAEHAPARGARVLRPAVALLVIACAAASAAAVALGLRA